MTDVNLPTVINDDDSDDVGRVIQGTLLKCVDGNWRDRDGLPIPANTQLLAVGSTTIIQRWLEQMPIDTIVKRPGEPLPDVDQLNSLIPQNEWEEGIDGKPRPPWQRQLVVYLLDEATAEKFTFASGTIGARIAVENLRDRMRSMRALRGVNVVPVIELANKPMKTRFGGKMRPEFKIMDWREFGGGAPAVPQLEHAPIKSVAAPTASEEMRDEVKY